MSLLDPFRSIAEERKWEKLAPRSCDSLPVATPIPNPAPGFVHADGVSDPLVKGEPLARRETLALTQIRFTSSHGVIPAFELAKDGRLVTAVVLLGGFAILDVFFCLVVLLICFLGLVGILGQNPKLMFQTHE